MNELGAQKGGTKRCQGAQKGVRNRLLTIERFWGNPALWDDQNEQLQGVDLSRAEPCERADADLYEGRRLHRVRDGA
jgi:hypothetical protein